MNLKTIVISDLDLVKKTNQRIIDNKKVNYSCSRDNLETFRTKYNSEKIKKSWRKVMEKYN